MPDLERTTLDTTRAELVAMYEAAKAHRDALPPRSPDWYTAQYEVFRLSQDIRWHDRKREQHT